jgi:hypothetical protein
MPSPTPRREVRCEACGSSHPHSPGKPMPKLKYWESQSELAGLVRRLMQLYSCCVAGCTGCWPRPQK